MFHYFCYHLCSLGHVRVCIFLIFRALGLKSLRFRKSTLFWAKDCSPLKFHLQRIIFERGAFQNSFNFERREFLAANFRRFKLLLRIVIKKVSHYQSFSRKSKLGACLSLKLLFKAETLVIVAFKG